MYKWFYTVENHSEIVIVLTNQSDLFYNRFISNKYIPVCRSTLSPMWSHCTVWAVNWLNYSMTDMDCKRITGTNVAGFSAVSKCLWSLVGIVHRPWKIYNNENVRFSVWWCASFYKLASVIEWVANLSVYWNESHHRSVYTLSIGLLLRTSSWWWWPVEIEISSFKRKW